MPKKNSETGSNEGTNAAKSTETAGGITRKECETCKSSEGNPGTGKLTNEQEFADNPNEMPSTDLPSMPQTLDAETADTTTTEATTPETPTPPDPADIIIERYGLSPRESDVLPLLLEGRTIVRIQETLFISAGTVSTHIRHIYQKTGQANRQELIDLAKSIAENECNVDNNAEK